MSKVTPQDLLDLFRGHLAVGLVKHLCQDGGTGNVTADIWGGFVRCRSCQLKISQNRLNKSTIDNRSHEDYIDLSDFEVQGISG